MSHTISWIWGSFKPSITKSCNTSGSKSFINDPKSRSPKFMSPRRSSKPPFFPASIRSAASLLSSSNVAAPPLGRLRPPTPNWALVVVGYWVALCIWSMRIRRKKWWMSLEENNDLIEKNRLHAKFATAKESSPKSSSLWSDIKQRKSNLWPLLLTANPTNATTEDTAIAFKGRVSIVSVYVEWRVDVLFCQWQSFDGRKVVLVFVL